MLGVIVEVIGSIIVNYILRYPGALIIWMFFWVFSRKKISYQEILNQSIWINASMAIVFIIIILFIIQYPH